MNYNSTSTSVEFIGDTKFAVECKNSGAEGPCNVELSLAYVKKCEGTRPLYAGKHRADMGLVWHCRGLIV